MLGLNFVHRIHLGCRFLKRNEYRTHNARYRPVSSRFSLRSWKDTHSLSNELTWNQSLFSKCVQKEVNIILYCNNNRLFMTLNEMTLPLNPHSFGLAVWPTFWPFSGFVFRKNQGLRAGRWRAWSPAARSRRFGGTSARLSTSSVSSSSSVLSFKLCLLTNEILNAFASSSLGRYLLTSISAKV